MTGPAFDQGCADVQATPVEPIPAFAGTSLHLRKQGHANPVQ